MSEEKLEEIRRRLKQLDERIVRLERQTNENARIIEKVKNDGVPNSPYVELLQRCPTCGIVLGKITSYTCNRVNCPTGLGPVVS